MLINLSNHPVKSWSEKQLETARKIYGTVMDMEFPAVNPEASKEEVRKLAFDFFNKITKITDQCANQPLPVAVHIQGEFTFVFNLVTLLKSSGIKCVASTSKRNVTETSPGEKIIKFEFVQFREY